MSGAVPFPKALRWCLLGPFAAWVVLFFLHLLAGFLSGGDSFKGLFAVAALLAMLVQFVAVFVALVQLARGRYRSRGNFIVIAIAAAPWALMFLAMLLMPGSRIHF